MSRKRTLEYIATSLLYESRDTLFSKLNPAIKLAYVIITFVIVFTVNNFVQLLYLLAVNVIIVVMDKVIRKRFIMMLKGLKIFIAFIVLFNIVVTYLIEDTDIISALLYQSYAISRILTILPPVLILMSTTTPLQIVHLFSKLGIKYYYLYPFVIAYKFIPIIFQEMKNVYDAQRSRGIELEKGGVSERLRKLSSIIIPTIVCSFIRARDLSEALVLRGFGYKEKRTFYKPLIFTKIDILFISIISLAYILVLAISYLDFINF